MPSDSDDPIACSCTRAGHVHRRLAELLAVRDGGGKQPCRWSLGALETSSISELTEAACQLADAAMRWRCRGAMGSYMLWRDCIRDGSKLTGADREKVVPFVRTAFGIPGAELPDAHLCGWVAEFLWYRLAGELSTREGQTLRRLEGPGFHGTEPGGDGLAVWQRDDEVLTFCLWEIKNHVGESALTATIRRAYGQLHHRATEYLAKLTGIAAAAEDGQQVGELYSELVTLWVDGSDRAAAGVAVGTHHRLAPSRCFTTMHKHFPDMSRQWQLQGLIAAVGNFDDFARTVRDRVWIAL